MTTKAPYCGDIGTVVTFFGSLTATAAELNKLSGASANVTAANLGTLTAGSTTDADALHKHAQYDMPFPLVSKAYNSTLEWGKTNMVAAADAFVNFPTISAGDVGKSMRIIAVGNGFQANVPSGVSVGLEGATGTSWLYMGAGVAGNATATVQSTSTTKLVVVAYAGSHAVG
jgi:hypothetical protein